MLGDGEIEEGQVWEAAMSAQKFQRQWAGLLDRFYQILPFGTGGRRGPVGIGPNRMNLWTVGASVQGHCDHLKARFQKLAELHVAIAYDVRRFLDKNRTGYVVEGSLAITVVIADDNGSQQTEPTAKVLDLRPVPPRWEAFGWFVQEVNGHDLNEILAALHRGQAQIHRPPSPAPRRPCRPWPAAKARVLLAKRQHP